MKDMKERNNYIYKVKPMHNIGWSTSYDNRKQKKSYLLSTTKKKGV